MEKIIAGSSAIELVFIPPGEFIMGSNNETFSEAPPHRVEIRQGFYLGRYPITQEQWVAVKGGNPSRFAECPDHPVESVSWDDGVKFCDVLTLRNGYPIRLPSEAEWEYACRAGSSGEFFFRQAGPFNDESDISTTLQAELRDYAWFDQNSRETTHSVGCKRPNPWGLHDIVGNVWEWCADVWRSDYAGAPDDGSPRMTDGEKQPRRCLRGGAWDMNAFRCRSTYRSFDWKELATDRFGLRIAMDSP
ncbi:formylglycine-generating enzyme family protein [Singulisphaera rosea]